MRLPELESPALKVVEEVSEKVAEELTPINEVKEEEEVKADSPTLEQEENPFKELRDAETKTLFR